MKKFVRHLFLPLFAILPFHTLASPIMSPGAWDMSMKVTATNPKTGQKVNVGNTRSTFCLTDDFLAGNPYLSPSVDEEKMRRKGASCSTSDYSSKENSARWTMTCIMANGKQIDSKISVSVAAKKMTSKIKQSINADDGIIHTKTVTQSKYKGEFTSGMLRL